MNTVISCLDSPINDNDHTKYRFANSFSPHLHIRHHKFTSVYELTTVNVKIHQDNINPQHKAHLRLGASYEIGQGLLAGFTFSTINQQKMRKFIHIVDEPGSRTSTFFLWQQLINTFVIIFFIQLRLRVSCSAQLHNH